MALRLLYRDDRVVAVDKPAGRLVIPGRGPEDAPPLNHELEAELGTAIFVVHRLDREASGIVLFALDAEAHRSLCGQFAGRVVDKRYEAVVLGAMPDAGEIAKPLRTFGSGRMGVGTPGKRSVTQFRTLARLRDASHVELKPLTGRRHQLRVHCYALGHPILGDPLYGEPRPVGGAGRLLLHAASLEFELPTGGRKRVDSALPEDFQGWLERLRLPGRT